MRTLLKRLDSRAPWLGFLILPVFVLCAALAIFAEPVGELRRSPGKQMSDGWAAIQQLWSLGWAGTNVPARLANSILAVALLSLYIYWWKDRSRRAFFRTRVDAANPQLSVKEVRRGLKKVARRLPKTWISAPTLQELESQLVGSRLFERITEDVALEGWILRRLVTVNTGLLGGTGPHLVVITQPTKPSPYRDFELTAGNVRLLSSDETTAISLRLLVRRLREVYGSKPTKNVVNSLVQALNEEQVSQHAWETVQSAMRAGACIPVENAQEEALSKVALELIHRRAVIGVSESGWPSSFSYRFLQPVTFPSKGDRWVPLSRWLTWKRRIRKSVGMPPKIVSFPIRRANYCRRYRVSVSVPQGMYIREVGVWDYESGNWKASNRRGPLYRHFISADVSADLVSGRASLSAPWESAAPDRFDPRFALRISEVPPGQLALPAVLATAVALAVWVIGTFFPHGQSINVDAVALALAVPVLGMTIFAARSQGVASGSLANVIHTIVSVAVSVATIVTLFAYSKAYAQDASGEALALRRIMDRSHWNRSALFMLDPPWIALATMAIANAVWIGISLQVAIARYNACRLAAGARYT